MLFEKVSMSLFEIFVTINPLVVPSFYFPFELKIEFYITILGTAR